MSFIPLGLVEIINLIPFFNILLASFITICMIKTVFTDIPIRFYWLGMAVLLIPFQVGKVELKKDLCFTTREVTSVNGIINHFKALFKFQQQAWVILSPDGRRSGSDQLAIVQKLELSNKEELLAELKEKQNPEESSILHLILASNLFEAPSHEYLVLDQVDGRSITYSSSGEIDFDMKIHLDHNNFTTGSCSEKLKSAAQDYKKAQANFNKGIR